MRRALVVDDDREMADVIRLLLRLLDFDAAVAFNAGDCLYYLAHAGVPDVMTLDMSMPGVGGLGMLAYLRRDPGYDRLPIVVLSTETQPEMVDRALAAGADAYLFKPATLEELDAAVKRAVSKRA